jgi:hypothetical protein
MCVALMGVSAAQRDAPMPSVLQAAGRARSWLSAHVGVFPAALHDSVVEAVKDVVRKAD